MDGISMRDVARAAILVVLGCASFTSQAQVLISELLYDAAGTDSGNVFVELYGAPGLSLDGYMLHAVNGSNGDVYKDVLLSGVIPGDGVFVIGDDSGGTTAIMNTDLIADVDFQNGPDSVQLSDGTAIIDALGYGDFSSAIFAGEGTAAPATSGGSSLARTAGLIDTDNNAVDFEILDLPTPGSVPLSAVPVPAAVWLFGSGLVFLVSAARRSRFKAVLA